MSMCSMSFLSLRLYTTKRLPTTITGSQPRTLHTSAHMSRAVDSQDLRADTLTISWLYSPTSISLTMLSVKSPFPTITVGLSVFANAFNLLRHFLLLILYKGASARLPQHNLTLTSRTTYITTATSVTLLPAIRCLAILTKTALVSPKAGEGIYARAYAAKTAARLRTLFLHFRH